jgi:hypothetical protein
MDLNQCPAMVGSACQMMLALLSFEKQKWDTLIACHQTAPGSLAKVENISSGVLNH